MKNSKILIIIGVIILIIASSMTVYNKYIELKAGEKSIEVLKELKSDIKEEKEKTLSLNIDGNDYIGIISIPSLNLELPIMNNYDNLNIAPGRYYGSQENDNLIICAHAYKKHFKYIRNLSQKDIIIITNTSNEKVVYEVLEVEILSPTEVEKMINNDFDLTLYTCTSDGLNRITVRANRVN